MKYISNGSVNTNYLKSSIRPLFVGPPQATPQMTQEQLEREGLFGVYTLDRPDEVVPPGFREWDGLPHINRPIRTIKDGSIDLDTLENYSEFPLH